MQVDVKHSLSKSLFGDVNFENLDSQAHSLFITERVLTRGTIDDFKVLKNYFEIEKLKAIIVEIKNLDERTLSFCAAYFSVPKKI